MEDRKRCCANCRHIIRKKEEKGDVHCFCALYGHYIEYVEVFEGWCRRWKKDRNFDGRHEDE